MDKALPDRLAFAHQWFPVVIKGTSKKVVRNLVVHRGLRIEGQVVDPSGLGVVGARIYIVSPEHRKVFDRFPWIKADPIGRFKLGPLLPGKYELAASPGSSQSPYLTVSEVVTTTAGSTGVVMRLRLGGIIEGRVFPSNGKDSQWTVSPRSKEIPYFRGFSRTDKDARFRLGPFPEGTYDLCLRDDNARPPRIGLVSGIRVTAGQTLKLPDIDCTRPDIDCTGTRRSPVRVAIPGVDDFLARTFAVEIVGADGNEIGTHRVRSVPCDYSLPTGTYRFILRVDGQVKAEQQVVVAPGQTAPVILNPGL